MFGLNIFVRVQTFRRVPPVLPRNFCHPDYRWKERGGRVVFSSHHFRHLLVVIRHFSAFLPVEGEGCRGLEEQPSCCQDQISNISPSTNLRSGPLCASSVTKYSFFFKSGLDSLCIFIGLSRYLFDNVLDILCLLLVIIGHRLGGEEAVAISQRCKYFLRLVLKRTSFVWFLKRSKRISGNFIHPSFESYCKIFKGSPH